MKKNNLFLISDGLYNATKSCANSEENVRYAKGIIVGMITGLMASGNQFEKAIDILKRGRDAAGWKKAGECEDILPECMPNYWQKEYFGESLLSFFLKNKRAFPGCYTHIAVMADGEHLCHNCVLENKDLIESEMAEPGIEKQWEIAEISVNWEDMAIACAHCGKELTPEYAIES